MFAILALFSINHYSGQAQSFGALFAKAKTGQNGDAGCYSKHPDATNNQPIDSFFVFDETSMTITAGTDCRTVQTRSNSSCVFKLGDDGVTQISFDFDISNECHTATGSCSSIQNGTVSPWLSFWMYSKNGQNPYERSAEVDFIETNFGPGCGLNTNFGGLGTQQVIYPADPNTHWTGTITASFSGSGTSVKTTITNSVNSNVASTTLSRDFSYFFVLNTSVAAATTLGCTVTISNLKMEGTVPSGMCTGIPVND